MTVNIRDKNFRIVNTSRNLRGILGWTATRPVERIDIWANRSGSCAAGHLGIAWKDGSSVITDFASLTVCIAWVEARRAWRGVSFQVHPCVKTLDTVA